MLSTLESPTFVSEHQDNIMSNFLYRHCDESQLAVFGYTKDIPGVETLRAAARFDYRGSILTGGNLISDVLEEDESSRGTEIRDLLESEGLVGVGGYAVDSLPRSLNEFKRMFSLVEMLQSAQFSNDFLVVAQVIPTGIFPIAAMKIVHEVNNFGSTPTSAVMNHGHALDIFRKGWNSTRAGRDSEPITINV